MFQSGRRKLQISSWNGGFTLALSGPDLTPSPKASQRFHKTMSFWNSVNLKCGHSVEKGTQRCVLQDVWLKMKLLKHDETLNLRDSKKVLAVCIENHPLSKKTWKTTSHSTVGAALNPPSDGPKSKVELAIPWIHCYQSYQPWCPGWILIKH